ncbi:hypothetical protein ACP275_09G125500 [Erythranthe tilingii]
MYGGSKMGRGGGGGGSAGKRNIHAPPINRSAPAGRLSVGGGPRGRGGASSAAISPPSASSLQLEESFSLVRENPLSFGMAIKLTPDLLEEIKRVEAQGGTARMKFDVNANNPNENVIHVGDKNFKFTWSREPGDLCDIYEERQSGEDGNGLLVESGGTWRKLSVERELDESTKNHVKRLSEEAERKHKSRTSIVLDGQNPSVKNQRKPESNHWSSNNKKEPPYKKPKSGPPAGGPPKPLYKSGLSTTTISKVKSSSGSPLSLQSDQHGAPATPIGSVNLVKGHPSVPDCTPAQNMNKTAVSDKEMQSKLPGSANYDKSKHNRNTVAKPTDLRSLIISLLLENQSKGMSLKALEKAIGDAMPNSVRQMEPILKQIANLQAPGRYFLKPGVEMDSFKKPPSQSGRSPEINRQQSHAPQKFDKLPAQDPFSTKTTDNNEEHDKLDTTPLHTVDGVEKIDILHSSPEQFSEKKVSNITEGKAGSSSDSGSDSDTDSDSSDSGSDSGSHSRKSRSPVGSQSGSSSDSDSDASSSSKQASDEDVDIMTSDDDKESKHKLRNSEPVTSKSPVQWSHPDNESVDIGNYDDHVSGVVEIEKDSPEDDHGAERPASSYLYPNKEGEATVEAPVEEIKTSSTHHQEQERQVYDKKTYDGADTVVNDGFKHGQPVNHEKSSKSKSKRRNDGKHSDERAHSKKKLKRKNSSQPVSGTINSIFGDSPYNSSPDRPLQVSDKGGINVMGNRMTSDGTSNSNSQTGYNQVTPTRFASDSQLPGQRSFEARGTKHSERSPQTNKGMQIQKGFNTEARSEDGLGGETRPMKLSVEGVADKHATVKDSHYRKPDPLGRVKEAVPHSNSYMRFSPKDNTISTTDKSPPMNGRGGRVLQRELSELELGEFREPFHEETPGPKKQTERKSTSKQLENKPMDSEYWNSDFGKGKGSKKITADPGKLPPLNSVAVISGIPDGPSKKRKAPEIHIDKSTRSLDQHHQSWGDHIEVGSQQNKVPETSGKSRFAEAGTGRGGSLEPNGDTSRKVSVTSTEQPNDLVRGVARHTAKESKKQKPNLVGDSNDRRKSASLTVSNDGGQKRKEPSSDDNSCSYTKYEKEQPELKGPIKNASQYKEYVKEFQEKYESHCSLNKILETYRDDFSKLGKDLESFKGRDMKRYHDILEQMRSSFRQCGERHKRLKKIYVVLYEELKVHLKQMIKDYAASYRKD